jgi:hypothetical protein
LNTTATDIILRHSPYKKVLTEPQIGWQKRRGAVTEYSHSLLLHLQQTFATKSHETDMLNVLLESGIRSREADM